MKCYAQVYVINSIEVAKTYCKAFGVERNDTYSTDVVGANGVGLKVIWINHKAESNSDSLSVHCIRNTSELIGKVKDLMI